MENGTPPILNLGTGWGWVVSYKQQVIYP